MMDARTLLVVLVALAFASCTEGPPQPEMKIPEDSASISDFISGRTAARNDTAVTSQETLRQALQRVLEGPTQAERDAGVQSWFSAETANALRAVTIDAAGHVIVDFTDLRTIIPNASSSAGSQMLLNELNAAVFAFPEAQSVEYRIEGSCDVFGEWVQTGCVTIERPRS